MDLAMYHAEKSGHESFDESTEAIKPLTEEEREAKLAERAYFLLLITHTSPYEACAEALEAICRGCRGAARKREGMTRNFWLH